MKARDIMTPDPTIVSVNDNVRSVARAMADRDIGACIVCNDEGRLQGMITDRDLTVEVLAEGRDPEGTTIGELVDGSEVVTIGADDSVDLAVQTMQEHAVRRLPVIDGTKVIGIVSQGDLALNLNAEEVGTLVESISGAPDNTARG